MEKDKILDLFSDHIKEDIKDKFIHVESYMMAGKRLNVIYIADDERTLFSFKEECFKPIQFTKSIDL